VFGTSPRVYRTASETSYQLQPSHYKSLTSDAVFFVCNRRQNEWTDPIVNPMTCYAELSNLQLITSFCYAAPTVHKMNLFSVTQACSMQMHLCWSGVSFCNLVRICFVGHATHSVLQVKHLICYGFTEVSTLLNILFQQLQSHDIQVDYGTALLDWQS